MKITSVEKNRKIHNVLSVYIDNEFSFCIPEKMFVKLGLTEKQEISCDELQTIKSDVIMRHARERAIVYLQTRLRSVDEVRKKLRAEGYDKETIEIILEELVGLGYLNDRMFAQKYLYDRKKLKPKSKWMLRNELLSKGIDKKIADDVLSEWKIDDDTMAKNLVKRKFSKYDMTDEKTLKRIYYFLRHRGFSYETIKKVIESTNAKD